MQRKAHEGTILSVSLPFHQDFPVGILRLHCHAEAAVFLGMKAVFQLDRIPGTGTAVAHVAEIGTVFQDNHRGPVQDAAKIVRAPQHSYRKRCDVKAQALEELVEDLVQLKTVSTPSLVDDFVEDVLGFEGGNPLLLEDLQIFKRNALKLQLHKLFQTILICMWLFLVADALQVCLAFQCIHMPFLLTFTNNSTYMQRCEPIEVRDGEGLTFKTIIPYFKLRQYYVSVERQRGAVVLLTFNQLVNAMMVRTYRH